jgi:hypothetical protein
LGHPSKEYYAFEIENLRTHPVYFPGREPDGYWEMLQRAGPQPLIAPEKLNTEDDWVNAGRLVFEQADFLHLRTRDPKFIEEARSREQLERAGVRPLLDGTLVGLRWVPTREGIAISSANCSFCHTEIEWRGAGTTYRILALALNCFLAAANDIPFFPILQPSRSIPEFHRDPFTPSSKILHL